MGHQPDRHAPGANIARRRRADEAPGDAVLASDTQTKACLGPVHRAGTPCTAEPVEPFAHDWGSASQGQRLPHGLEDLRNQPAHSHLKTRHATSAWWGDSGAVWWAQAGRVAPPQAPRRLGLGDGGGRHRATPYLCTAALPGLAKRLGRERRVAHYPPYGAKPKPIAPQGFPHITRAGPGVPCHIPNWPHIHRRL
jgi:hypothetical protein